MNTVSNLKGLPPQNHAHGNDDDRQARFGRERHEGFKIGRWVQSPPLLFTQDHHPLWLADIYRGRSAFLILGGPSFAKLDHNLLRQPGIITMGVNNSPKSFRPNLWTSVDSPSHFLKSIWLDPLIQKYVPICHVNKPIFDSNKWAFDNIKVGDCPNMVYYKRNERFKAKQFLWEDCFNWGNHKDFGGSRSIMLVAIRLLHTLGFRKVYLLGCDFKMDEKNKYHFDQNREKGSINGNNKTYTVLNDRFKELRPIFEKENFFVYNCNPESGLTAFDHIEYKEAIRRVTAEMDNIDVKTERTAGLYETNDKEKEAGKGK